MQSASKATRYMLNSQQYHHLHGGLDLGSYYHAPNSLRCLKYIHLPYHEIRSSLMSIARKYRASIILNVTKSSSYRSKNVNNNGNNNSNKMVDLEIISREIIKLTFPTPHRLRTHNLSMIDQIMLDCYTPFALFIPNKNKATVTDVVTKRSKHLKDTLSEILTRFYPVGGEVKDNLHIECNDKGVYFIEARVNQTLEDFLQHPDDQKVRELMPENFRSLQSASGNYIAGVQVNIFNCGGIGLCSTLAHKIFDGHTYFMFMKAWAAALRDSPEKISPSFVSSNIFPSNPSLKHLVRSTSMTTKSLTTKRFFFDSTALALLKSQPVFCTSSCISLPTHGPTRMEATIAIIWKAAAKATSTVKPFGPKSPHALISLVNIRKRALPPLPNESIGNLVIPAGAICFPESQPDLPILMCKIRESIGNINSDYTESMKGEKGHEVTEGILRMLINNMADGMDEENRLVASSLLNTGIYEIDFGWGKPVWFYVMSPGVNKLVTLNDTIMGGCVEATVTLSSNEMEIFERDPGILSYAIVNPSPLRYLHG